MNILEIRIAKGKEEGMSQEELGKPIQSPNRFSFFSTYYESNFIKS